MSGLPAYVYGGPGHNGDTDDIAEAIAHKDRCSGPCAVYVRLDLIEEHVPPRILKEFNRDCSPL